MLVFLLADKNSSGDHPGQGFPLSEEVAEPNGVKAAARGRRRFVSDQREQRPLGGGISGEENPAGGSKHIWRELLKSWETCRLFSLVKF